MRFVHFGRLVFHKGTSLIIESLAQTQQAILLDVIGRGPELERCQHLAHELGIYNRVQFLDWFKDRRALFDSLSQYRGLLLPSLEDANGMVVQEAMAIGLPVICLDWGGPQLLIEDEETGYLIAPESKAYIVEKMAEYLDRLSQDGTLAEKMGLAGRNRAKDWCWSRVADDWLRLYGSGRQSSSNATLAYKGREEFASGRVATTKRG
jgi:glycosyltransferase involved in cell wall biosynthesis